MTHPTDDDFERYWLDMATDEERVEIEEHLLACARCLKRAECAADFIEVIRTALDFNALAGGNCRCLGPNRIFARGTPGQAK